jgi:hypothetical protein
VNTETPAWVSRILRTSGLAGVVLVALLHAIDATDPLARALAAAAMIAMPLGLGILPSRGPTWNALFAIAACAQPLAGAAVVVALTLPVGRDAGLYCVPWMMFALLCAAMGIARIFGEGGFRPAELCRGAALLYLPIGAGWLAAWRAGIQPFGFSSPTVALTAIHFHFSAFAAPLLAAAAIRALGDRRIAAIAGVAIVAAQPIVAFGISVSPIVGFAGALLLAVALVTLSVLTLFRVQRSMRSTGARVLLCASACAPFVSMPLAILWSWSEMTRTRSLELETMVALHGVVNAYVFAVGGLVAWTWEALAERAA